MTVRMSFNRTGSFPARSRRWSSDGNGPEPVYFCLAITRSLNLS